MKELGEINQLIEQLESFYERNLISDGFHTFGELYHHRIMLYVLLCKLLVKNGYRVWKSELQSDGTIPEGMFILGVNTEQDEQISYHLAEQFWESTEFAEVLEKAPEYDGHTPEDVLHRLSHLVSKIAET